MEIQSGIGEEVTKSDILGLEMASWNQLASWDRQRSDEELRSRVNRRLAELATVEDES